MEKYENPEYEMLKNSTEHIVQETSTNNKKVNTPSDTANLKGIASLVLGLITILINHNNNYFSRIFIKKHYLGVYDGRK